MSTLNEPVDFFSKVMQNQSIFCNVEKLPVKVFRTPMDASKMVASCIANTIREKQAMDEYCILGLATGSTPVVIYRELIRLHKEEGLSLKNCITFNLDEYYPMDPLFIHSYHRYMHENFFNHVDIPKSQIYIPLGNIPVSEIKSHCEEYEKTIRDLGGIDIQILGIGRTGHIGFNEPWSTLDSVTRKITLDQLTRLDAISGMGLGENAPNHAITMGIKTIMQARRIFIMAFSESKSKISKIAIEGEKSLRIPATCLYNHPSSIFILDAAAAEKLTRFTCPWVVNGPTGSFEADYDKFMTRKAVSWLSEKTGKVILSLEENDYRENGLLDLLLQNKCTAAD